MVRAARILAVLVLTAVAPAHASNEPAWIGIDLAAGRAGGVLIRGVVHGAPGDRARLRAGDEVLSIDGESVATPEQLTRAVRSRSPGSIVHLRLAGSPEEDRLVKLEERPDPLAIQRRSLEGKPAPDFAPPRQWGPKVASLSALKGRVVLIDFFATWCQPCMEALPRIQALHRELGPRGLAVIGVSDEPPEIVREVRRRGVAYTLVQDERSEVARRYQVSALPTMVVIDQEGAVRRISIADEALAERAVRDLLDGAGGGALVR